MTDYQKEIQRLKECEIAFEAVPDRAGNPYYIVEKKDDPCPPGRAETFYRWGLKFTPDGKLDYVWGDKVVPIH